MKKLPYNINVLNIFVKTKFKVINSFMRVVYTGSLGGN